MPSRHQQAGLQQWRAFMWWPGITKIMALMAQLLLELTSGYLYLFGTCAKCVDSWADQNLWSVRRLVKCPFKKIFELVHLVSWSSQRWFKKKEGRSAHFLQLHWGFCHCSAQEANGTSDCTIWPQRSHKAASTCDFVYQTDILQPINNHVSSFCADVDIVSGTFFWNSAPNGC